MRSYLQRNLNSLCHRQLQNVQAWPAQRQSPVWAGPGTTG